jgi:hypothetical protein
MNNKHFGCMALGLFIILMGHWTNASYKKLRLARDAEEISCMKHLSNAPLK